MKNAKRLLRKLDYLPRWAWYAMSLAIGGPVGPVVVYVAFHALQKAADDEDAEYDEWSTDSERREGGYADADCTVTDDRDIEDAWQRTEASAWAMWAAWIRVFCLPAGCGCTARKNFSAPSAPCRRI